MSYDNLSSLTPGYNGSVPLKCVWRVAMNSSSTMMLPGAQQSGMYNSIESTVSDPYLSKSQSFLSMRNPLIPSFPVSTPLPSSTAAPFLPTARADSHSMDWGRPSLNMRYSRDSSLPPLDDTLLHKDPSQDVSLFNALVSKTEMAAQSAPSERESFETRKSMTTPPLAERRRRGVA